MICTLTARRLKPGAYDDFRAAWGPEEGPAEIARRWTRIYSCRDVDDEDVVLSFGFFDGTLDELRQAQQQWDRDRQLTSVEPYVEAVLFDGSFEALEEITP